MDVIGAMKELSISAGIYRQARAAYRVLKPSARKHFFAHRLLLSEFVKAGDLAFDVGANIGNRTEILLSLGASVVSFEPQPKCAREISALQNGHLTVVQKAVGEAEGGAKLHLKASSVLASLLPNHRQGAGAEDVDVMPVDVTTLDKAIDQFGLPSFCKIDVEGFEFNVLRGLSRQIPAVSLEYRCDKEGVEAVKECLDLLSRLGDYRVNLIGQESANFICARWLTLKEFVGTFPNCATGNFWGDLFAKTAE
jgi:FkbM family methyltransferase